MTILEIVNKACTRTKFNKIDDLFIRNDNQVKEFLEYINAAVDDILSAYNWQELTKDYTFITTTPETNEYDLPPDFYDFLTNYIFDDSRQLVLASSTNNSSLSNKILDLNTDNVSWRKQRNKIIFDTNIDAGRTLMFTYKSKNCIVGEDGLLKSNFTLNTDRFLLDDEALVRGIVAQKAISYGDTDWQLRENQFKSKLMELAERNMPRTITNIFGEPRPSRIAPVQFVKEGGECG